jgi:hypothetical protein
MGREIGYARVPDDAGYETCVGKKTVPVGCVTCYARVSNGAGYEIRLGNKTVRNELRTLRNT